MANISTLTVSLVADTAKFLNGLKKGRRGAQRFSKAVKKASKVVVIAFAAMAAATAKLVVESLKLVDEQSKAARTLGTTQAVYSGLALAAGIAGLSTTSFAKALKRQQKSIVDASDGLQTQARAFERLGLQIDDLIKLPVQQQFETITKALGKVENATIKVGIASDIFGAKNADLINIIELSEAGLQKYIDLSAELGVALSQDQTKAIEDANDAWLIFKTSITGIGNQLAAELAPEITNITGKLTDLSKSIADGVPAFAAWLRLVAGSQADIDKMSVNGIIAEQAFLQEEINKTTFSFNNLTAQMQQKLQSGTPVAREREQIAVLNEALGELTVRYDFLTGRLIELRTEAAKPIPVPGAGGEDDTKGPLGFSELQVTDGLREQADALQASVDQWGKWRDAATKAFEDTRTPIEIFNAQIQEIMSNPFLIVDPELQQRAIDGTIQTLHDGLDALKDQTDETMSEMTEFTRRAFSNMQDTFSDFLFDPFEDGLDGMVKGFADTLRRMVADLLASKLLGGFFSLFGGGGGILGAVTGGGSSIPGRAIGGQAAKTQVVGENGPELFSPGASGSIRPLTPGNFQFNTTIGGGGDGLSLRTLMPILEQRDRQLMAKIIDSLDRGAFA